MEHTKQLDHTSTPDYELDDLLVLTRPDQFKAIVGDIRPRILGLLAQRAATIKQIAQALGLSKGTTGHHIAVLEAAGLVRVVRTRQVRAVTEKYYGRVARTFRVSTDECAPGVSGISVPQDVMLDPLRRAISEFAPSGGEDDPSEFMLSHARLRPADAHEFALRLEALFEEFSRRSIPGERVFGFVAGVYLANWPDLPEEKGEEDEQP